MKKPRIRLLYEDKNQLDYILNNNEYAHKYFTFVPKKYSFDKSPKERDGRYIDRNYLYEKVEQYDGVLALIEGNDLKGVFGNHKFINGKLIMQCEYQDGVYRTWIKKGVWEIVGDTLKHGITGHWKLGKTKRKTKYYQPVYTFDHECGHAVCDYHGIKDTLHQHISDKDYEGFWKYVDEELKKQIKPDGLLPVVDRLSKEFIKHAKTIGLDLRITSGFRSIEMQDVLYSQGRTTTGNMVTNARGGQSFHNYGVAFDIVDRKKGYNLTDQEWSWLRFIWRYITKRETGHFGEWGGDWTSFVDKPHFELTLGYKLKDFQNNKVDYQKFL